MTYKRLLLVIAVMAVLGLVTVWQQVQTMRWGYRISESVEAKKRLLEEQKNLDVELSAFTSPSQLLVLAQKKGIAMDYRLGVNMLDATATLSVSSHKTASINQ